MVFWLSILILSLIEVFSFKLIVFWADLTLQRMEFLADFLVYIALYVGEDDDFFPRIMGYVWSHWCLCVSYINKKANSFSELVVQLKCEWLANRHAECHAQMEFLIGLWFYWWITWEKYAQTLFLMFLFQLFTPVHIY